MPAADQREPPIHYEIVGSTASPTLVMLRGLGRSLRHWEGVLEALEDHFRLVVLDNRGIGRSGRVARPYGTAAMADDVARVLDHAGIERANLFGMSLGGMIAQQFALRHPGRLERLILGCTTPGGNAPRARLATLLPYMRARLDGMEAAIHFEATFLLSDGFRREHPEIIDSWIAIAREQPVPLPTLLQHVLAATCHDTSKRLGQIRCDTLIVSSDCDALIPPECSRILARGIPRSELAWLEGAGHDFATERPREITHLLTSFIH